MDWLEIRCKLMKRGGEYMGFIRRWMQTAYRNGDAVIWGSDTQLHGKSYWTPKDHEDLASDIAAAALTERFTSDESRGLRLASQLVKDTLINSKNLPQKDVDNLNRVLKFLDGIEQGYGYSDGLPISEMQVHVWTNEIDNKHSIAKYVLEKEIQNENDKEGKDSA